MTKQTEFFALTKEEAIPMLIKNEIRRMQIENELDAQKEIRKSYRDELKIINGHIDQLSVICNKKE